MSRSRLALAVTRNASQSLPQASFSVARSRMRDPLPPARRASPVAMSAMPASHQSASDSPNSAQPSSDCGHAYEPWHDPAHDSTALTDTAALAPVDVTTTDTALGAARSARVKKSHMAALAAAYARAAHTRTATTGVSPTTMPYSIYSGRCGEGGGDKG